MNESDFCCIKQVTKSIPITIPLKYITKEIAAVSEILEGWKRQYVPKLQGVLVNYRNIRLSAGTVAVHSSRTAPKCTITATFDMFCPTVGEIVKGTINRISREHIGCLIEGTINVSIHRQKHSPSALSKFIKINHPILFEIESFFYDRQTIRVKGRFTPECVELMKEVFPASHVNGLLGNDSALSDDLFSNTESAADEAISNLDNLVERTNNSELNVEETLKYGLESPKIKSKKRKPNSESPTVAQEKKQLQLSVPNNSNSSLYDDSSDLELKVNEFSETPKNKFLKRKRESESSPTAGQVDKKRLKSSDPMAESSSNDNSSDSEEKVDSNDLIVINQESPSKKQSKKHTTSEQIKTSISDSSNSSSSDDSSDPEDKSLVNSIPVAIKQESSPSKKHHKNKSESPKKRKDKKKKKLKSSDKSESKKKKKSKKKDSKSKVSATGEVLKKDKKKSKKDKKIRKIKQEEQQE